MQVLFPLNELYFVGDDINLAYVAQFTPKPTDVIPCVEEVLYPEPGENRLEQQCQLLCSLIYDTLQLTEPILTSVRGL